MGAPEQAIERYLQRKCAACGILCRKFASPGSNGYPDRILVHDGIVVFVELKRPGGKPRKLQEVRMHELESHGAKVCCCDTRESVDTLLEKHWPKQMEGK